MSNSSLISYTKLSPNHSGKRNHKIDMVAIHCMAGNLSVESCGALFARSSTQASSNYGIGSDGRIALYVDEDNRSWCTSSSAVDNRAVTIEVANTEAKHPWPVSKEAYNSLINLLVDICQRNNIERLLWQDNKSLFGQIDKQNMAIHCWFANKSCPGQYLHDKHYDIVAEVNKRLQEEEMNIEQFKQLYAEMRKEWQDNDSSTWSKEARDWAKKTGIVQGSSDGNFNGAWEDVLTREQMITILYRFAKSIGKA